MRRRMNGKKNERIDRGKLAGKKKKGTNCQENDSTIKKD